MKTLIELELPLLIKRGLIADSLDLTTGGKNLTANGKVAVNSLAADIDEVKRTLYTIVDSLGVTVRQKDNSIRNNEGSSGGWTIRRELNSTPFEPPLCGYLTNLVMSPPGFGPDWVDLASPPL